jgi:cell division protein FtsB
MWLIKYLLPLWVTVFVYTLFSLLYGPTGFAAYDGIKTERDRQLANIASLERKSQELKGNRDALLYDGNTIAVYARELGYGTDNERFVRIAGLSKTMRRQYYAGDVIDAQTPESMDERNIKIISLITGGVILGFILFVRLLKMLV